MKTSRIPAIIFGLLYLCLLFYLGSSTSRLPARIATHFDASGQPNGWMNRSALVLFTAIFGLGFPLFVVGLSYMTRFFPNNLINIPHREYWLSPEHRGEAFDYLLLYSFWFACLAVCFVIGLHSLIIRANAQSPPALPGADTVGLIAFFLVGTAVWGVSMVRHFYRTT